MTKEIILTQITQIIRPEEMIETQWGLIDGITFLENLRVMVDPDRSRDSEIRKNSNGKYLSLWALPVAPIVEDVEDVEEVQGTDDDEQFAPKIGRGRKKVFCRLCGHRLGRMNGSGECFCHSTDRDQVSQSTTHGRKSYSNAAE